MKIEVAVELEVCEDAPANAGEQVAWFIINELMNTHFDDFDIVGSVVADSRVARPLTDKDYGVPC